MRVIRQPPRSTSSKASENAPPSEKSRVVILYTRRTLCTSGTGRTGHWSTDEDDADPAFVPFHDVALQKTTDATNVDIGDLVTFNIRVYNQGNLPLDSLKITDYVPVGLSFVDNNDWVAAGDNACLTATIGNVLIPAG